VLSLSSFFDFFLPRTCAVCGNKLNQEEEFICANCEQLLNPTELLFLKNEYSRKFYENKFIDEFYSPFLFSEENIIRNIIHELKYKNKFRAGIYLGKKICERFSNEIDNFNPETIIPIPLHKLKKAERGYNQSYYIAKGIGRSCGIKVKTNILKRKRYTKTQTKLSADERSENIKDAFRVKNKKAILGKNIILVDDVTTTGATTNEAAKLLKESGAKKILLLTAAIPY
jgi:ComF family protein